MYLPETVSVTNRLQTQRTKTNLLASILKSLSNGSSDGCVAPFTLLNASVYF